MWTTDDTTNQPTMNVQELINTLQEIKTNLGPNTLVVVREPGRKDAPGAMTCTTAAGPLRVKPHPGHHGLWTPCNDTSAAESEVVCLIDYL